MTIKRCAMHNLRYDDIEGACPECEGISLLSDSEVDRILMTRIPGGSNARDWFIPHESDKAKANIRDVVRLMLRATCHREAPSCNGSQQESQKLTGDSARETPRTDEASVTRHEIEDHGLEYTTADEFVEADFARQLERELNAKSRELEEARKDAGRLGWLEQQSVTIRNDNLLLVNPTRLREAIDIAIDSALHHDGK